MTPKAVFLGQHLELGGHMKAGTFWSHRVPTSGELLSPSSEAWKSFYPEESAEVSWYPQELSGFSIFFPGLANPQGRSCDFFLGTGSM